MEARGDRLGTEAMGFSGRAWGATGILLTYHPSKLLPPGREHDFKSGCFSRSDRKVLLILYPHDSLGKTCRCSSPKRLDSDIGLL